GQADTAGGASHAFLWQDGIMTDLGTLGGNDSAARAINNSTQIAGWANTAGGATDAFLWQNGVMTDLGQGTALPINDSGQVAETAGGNLLVTNFGNIVGGDAAVWQNGVLTDIAAVTHSSWGSSVATGINDNGLVSLYADNGGVEHAYTFNVG